MAPQKKKQQEGHPFTAVVMLLLSLLLVAADRFLGLGLFTETVPMAEGTAQAVFVDVGQGDATILAADGVFVLIDGGEEGEGNEVIQAARDLGVDRFDLVIATHPHSDHIGGIDEVMAAYPVDRIMMPDAENSSLAFERLLDAVDAQNLRIETPEPGDTLEMGSMTLCFLHPRRDVEYDMNDYSIAVRADLPGGSILLTGDGESAAEKEMLESGLRLQADVYKAAHHGSSTSNSRRFLERVDPDYAVISCGADNSYGHPHEEVLARLEELHVEIFSTAESGRVTVIFSSDAPIRVETEK